MLTLRPSGLRFARCALFASVFVFNDELFLKVVIGLKVEGTLQAKSATHLGDVPRSFIFVVTVLTPATT
jgi:hypothetical protein